MVSWASRNLSDGFTYTVRHGLLKGMKRKGGLGWLPQWVCGPAESPEHRFLAALDLDGKVVFDVGAFEGLMTLFFARRARHVVCYEPNSRNHARLLENLRLNRIQNVTVRKLGLGAAPCLATLVWDPAMAGGATLAGTEMARRITSQGSSRREGISLTTLDQDLCEAGLPQPDLLKIDIEGAELAALQGARQLLEFTHPALYLEMHGETLNEKRRNAQAILECLAGPGYRRIYHVESSRLVGPQDRDTAAQGHL